MKIAEIPEFVQERQTLTLNREDSVRDALNLLIDNNIGALPVLEDGALIGIFSERDIIKRVLGEGKDVDSTKIADVMTEHPDALSPNADVSDAIELMVTHKYRHMPIVDEENNLLGILSQRDFMSLSWMQYIKYKAEHSDAA